MAVIRGVSSIAPFPVEPLRSSTIAPSQLLDEPGDRAERARALGLAELVKLAGRTRSHRDFCFMALQLTTGATLAEISSLATGDFNRGLRSVKLSGENGMRVMPVPDAVAAELAIYLDHTRPMLDRLGDGGDSLWISSRDGGAMQPRSHIVIFRKLGADCGIRLTPYMFRWTFLAWTLQALEAWSVDRASIRMRMAALSGVSRVGKLIGTCREILATDPNIVSRVPADWHEPVARELAAAFRRAGTPHYEQ